MPSPGDTVDRFVVEAELGRGGMATVYRVRHVGLGSHHALKVLELRYESVRRRLVLEGQVQARLQHPNIVAVTDLIQVEGAPGLVLEYIDGPSLDVWLRDHRPEPETIATLFHGILDGVIHAHRHDLVHRDLKPGNVLLQAIDGRLVPKIADFGLAKLLTEDAPGRTRTGLAMGTPGYMAPEQIRSAKDADQRADVFALGCILYELWCGVQAFRGDSVFDVLVAIEARDFVPPRQIRPDLPDVVEAAILACLEPVVAQRPASATELRERLYPSAPSAPEPEPAGSVSPRLAPFAPTPYRPEPSAPTSFPQALATLAQAPPKRPGSERSKRPGSKRSADSGGGVAAVAVVVAVVLALTLTVAAGSVALFFLAAVAASVGPIDTGY